jgi:phosphate transport system permease protein
MNRSLIDKGFNILCWTAVGSCCVVLLFLLITITGKGIKAIDFEFLFTPAKNFGSAGGIFYQILGTFFLIVGAAVISFPLALGTAIFKSEYLKNRLLLGIIEAFIFGLNGVPSIIFGIFGLIFFVNVLNTGISWFVGAIILGIMIIPTITISTYQSINSIPKIYRESALALGLTQWQVITKVVLPQGIGGAITGLLLGIARAAGETAPIMFIATAFSGVDIPRSLFEPVTALPTHILALAQQATNKQALQNGWGASFVLLSIVMVFSISGLFSRIISRRINQR